MFDFHMHTIVSFDGTEEPIAMVRAAEAAGLQEICFTDHVDYDPLAAEQTMNFDTQAYNDAYDGLESDKVLIRRGMEFGLELDNQQQFKKDLSRRPFDFVLGSVHFVDNYDVYFPEFWAGKTLLQAEQRYLEHTLHCVQAHTDFDVLAHLTYLAKARSNPQNRPLELKTHREVIDAILQELVRKGKGLEVNTSGKDKCGVFLPEREYLLRFKELGGRIVTVGSDAHQAVRVGQYSREACQMLKEIFGYVCTFEDRKPIFHKL